MDGATRQRMCRGISCRTVYPGLRPLLPPSRVAAVPPPSPNERGKGEFTPGYKSGTSPGAGGMSLLFFDFAYTVEFEGIIRFP